jgi:hypothetical protein
MKEYTSRMWCSGIAFLYCSLFQCLMQSFRSQKHSMHWNVCEAPSDLRSCKSLIWPLIHACLKGLAASLACLLGCQFYPTTCTRVFRRKKKFSAKIKFATVPLDLNTGRWKSTPKWRALSAKEPISRLYLFTLCSLFSLDARTFRRLNESQFRNPNPNPHSAIRLKILERARVRLAHLSFLYIQSVVDNLLSID